MIFVSRKIPVSASFQAETGQIPERSLFFDIETTGLSRSASSLYLTGALYFDGDSWQLRQWLAGHPDDEKELLSGFLHYAQGFDCLIHFNGSSFDLPFLAEKCRIHGLKDVLSEKDSLDLYRRFLPLKRLLGLKRMNQASLQAYLGYGRRDKLDGKALIPVYHAYVSGKDAGLSEPLLLHNEEDLLGMTQLLSLFSYEKLLEGEICMKGCSVIDDSAVLSFQTEAPLPQKAACCIQDLFFLKAEGRSGTLTVPMRHDRLLYFFPNYRDYYYLPLEDQAVHKSVASFVDRKHRQPARPSNCYIRKESDFLPQPAEIFRPAFRASFESGQLYCEYDPKWEEAPGLLLEYVRAALRLY